MVEWRAVEVAVEEKEGSGGRSGLNMPPGPPARAEKSHDVKRVASHARRGVNIHATRRALLPLSCSTVALAFSSFLPVGVVFST